MMWCYESIIVLPFRWGDSIGTGAGALGVPGACWLDGVGGGELVCGCAVGSDGGHGAGCESGR